MVSWTIPSIYQYQIFKKHKKEMDRSNKKNIHIYKCIIVNTSVIRQHAAPTTDQLTSPNCQTGAIKKKPIS